MGNEGAKKKGVKGIGGLPYFKLIDFLEDWVARMSGRRSSWMRVLGECISIDGVAWPGTLYDAEV